MFFMECLLGIIFIANIKICGTLVPFTYSDIFIDNEDNGDTINSPYKITFPESLLLL